MAYENRPKYDSDIPEGHPSEESRDLKPQDRRLRGFGFKIRERRRGKQAMWERRGELMTESEALAWCAQQVENLDEKKTTGNPKPVGPAHGAARSGR